MLAFPLSSSRLRLKLQRFVCQAFLDSLLLAALDFRALVDARLMHWLLYPDSAGDPSVAGFLDSCVNQVESAAELLMREEPQGDSSAAPESGSRSLGEIFHSEKGESSPGDESDCTQGQRAPSVASTRPDTRMQEPGTHLSGSSFLHQLTVSFVYRRAREITASVFIHTRSA